jgi:hypothetical protein
MMVVGSMFPLPPDLSQLGDELTAAAGRALAERRRRRRLRARICASALSGVLAIAVLAPNALGPGLQLASPFAEEAPSTVLARPPERRPVHVTHEAPENVLVRLPDRRPLLPVVVDRNA